MINNNAVVLHKNNVLTTQITAEAPEPYIQEGHAPLHFSSVGGSVGHRAGKTENAQR